MSLATKLVAAIFALASLATATAAAAQVNCNVARTREALHRCLAAQAQIYRQQSQEYNAIADQQYRQHQQIGQALRHAPIFGPYIAPAWNAPRYGYDAYQRYRNR